MSESDALLKMLHERPNYSDLARFAEAAGEELTAPIRARLADPKVYTDEERRTVQVGVGSSPGIGCDHVVVVMPDVFGGEYRKSISKVILYQGRPLSAEVRYMHVHVPRREGR